ncbi:hypothetical protein MPMin1_gp15 [Microbacterium phage Min1]|uniref:Uncharacterized protein n=1 Tax=Microbacterium phage Min1 TaxID=446529 RepID=A6N1X3_9CAUD|nr:hypothetical protein MPMin1_gp15 [Microbacterium phage Min1]ABR10445.1 hypothetical protein [Microbacterium phage Min1]
MTPNIDDVAQTLAEYERLAIATGDKVQIDPPEFSEDGAAWSPFWIADAHPAMARVTVHRNGIATTVYVSWAESFPADDSWRALWLEKPMKLFGAYVVRAALRRAFRDAIGDRREPDEAPAALPVIARDWDAEVAAATTEDAVNALHRAMKDARAVTPDREAALRARLAEVSVSAWQVAPITASVPVPAAVVSTPSRSAPRDYLPPSGNRAARRARKKGRR